MRQHTSKVIIGVFFVFLAAGCGDSSGDNNNQPIDDLCLGGKCDALNPANDPANLGFTIKYELADEAMIGVTLRSDLIPYDPPTYWPFTSDGINKRQGSQSPAEKYDLAFSGWTPDASFFELERLDSTYETTFDQAYYDGLGPVATWEHNEHGLGRLHDGVDNDGDGQIDADDDNNEGLESWFGYCNGNTAASLSVNRPLHDVEHNGVTFTPYDIMALLSAVYYDDRSTMTGLRCESLHPEKDDYGRMVDLPWYRPKDDPEADMTFFTILQGPTWFDETREFVAYLVELDGQGGQRGIIRVAYDEFTDYRKDPKVGFVTLDQSEWTEIEFSTFGRGCRDTNPATLYLAVVNILGKNKIPFGIDADPGSHVWNYPIYEAVINEQQVVTKEQANERLGVNPENDYPFNDKAVNFAYVKLTLQESHSMQLEMILELDESMLVIGGEWVGASKSRHPDFIWMALGADKTGYNTEGTYMTFGDDRMDGVEQGGQITYTDAPDMAYSDVRRLLAMSRTETGETFQAINGQGASIPDNTTETFTVTMSGTANTVVRNVLVYMDAQAPFVPGLKVEIESPDGVTVKILDIPVSETDWAPGRFPTGWDLGYLRGVAHPMPLLDDNGDAYAGLKAFNGHPASGTWTLRIQNAGGGLATLTRWSLWITTAEQQ